MPEVRPIRTEAAYDAALRRIDQLIDAKYGSPEGKELDLLSDQVARYEAEHYPIKLPGNPLSAIEFRMDQMNLEPRDLVPLLGSWSNVSEVLAGKRPITLSMARTLHRHLGVSTAILLQEPQASLDETCQDLDPTQ